ncbi:bleomycin family antibiotic N-acetyltransferase TlmB [Streptoalloteichus hindustanus]|uniref:Protein N-acetyltransferase, RimJ/RimL family n=1 Tax=Streptoalloteichus hindustanus TaxID=2017 RepID=A4KUD4_STRHI|nr:bleomycin family antibiotic N-acetyltransferase TlmB [Streptoalloteichus hindustanus]ABL74962.1 TlmB [Streptoalloteichus hindustanus]SHF86459.1 Protein N-acetyltransferase, RimJ/RimL family [Streptoalloteichus hindustanus]
MELRTPRLRLIPLDPDRDASGLHAAFGDPEVMRWWNHVVCADVAETRERLRESVDRDGAHLWVIRRGEACEPAGMVGLLGEVDVPGLTWLLCKDAWGRGLATEAAGAVVEHALGPLDLPRVEAWVEATNERSLAVARRVGLTERGRLAQRYPHRERPHEMVVLGRARDHEPTPMLNAEVALPVRDVAATLTLLREALGGRTLFSVGDPPEVAGVSFGPWSVGPRLQLVSTRRWRIARVTLYLDVGVELEALHDRAVDAGADVVQRPTEQPWGMRECVVQLPEGHHIVLTAPA